MTFVWLAVALAFGVAEMLTLAFFALFFVIGAVAAAIAAQLGVSQVGQIIVFAVVSIIGVLGGRPPIMHYLKRGHTSLPSGAQSMVGQHAPVTDDILDAHHPGHVRVAGESWLAIPGDGNPIPAGSTVQIDGLRQATLVVSLVSAPPASPAPEPELPAESPTPSATPKEG